METILPHEHSLHGHHHSQLTPEKLALIKLTTNELNGDTMSDTGTVNIRRGSRLSRVGSTRSTRRQSSLLRTSSRMEASSYAKMSSELTSQAETKFMVLVDVIANASKEASSLKTIWERMKHEREVYLEEREDLLAQTADLTAELTTREEERSRHGSETIDRKKQVEKLLAELSTALANITTEKERVAERDSQLRKVSLELREVRESTSRHTSQYDRTRQELNTLNARLKQTELERDTAIQESERYHRELTKATRERSEVTTRLSDVTSSFEAAQHDAHSLTVRIKAVELEKEESLQTITQLKEELRRAKQQSVDDSKETIEAIERYEKASRELTKMKDSLVLVEAERDEHLQTIEGLRRQIKTHTSDHHELSTQLSSVTQRFEATKRELVSTQESLRTLEVGRVKDVENLQLARESLHSAVRERDELGDELSGLKRRLEEHKQQAVIADENLKRSEEKITDFQAELRSLSEQVHLAHHERDEAEGKSARGLTEITRLRERISALEHEKLTVIESRSKLSAELEHLRSEYSEVTETVTSFRDDADDMEQEIESLRALLHEAREQRERAIHARESADKERDEYIRKYEEKCVEIERFKESSFSRANSYSHSHHRASRGAGELRTSRTVITRSGNHSHMDQESRNDASHLNSSGVENDGFHEGSTETPVAA
ncbi:hypothetical protein RBB50_011071 [Rhinocladiella similis]